MSESNREIKFRGFWQTVKGEWQSAIGNLSIVDNKERNGCFISNRGGSPFAFNVIPSTIGQYTGLKDSNGKEIYEGDIIKGMWGISQIIFFHGAWCYLGGGATSRIYSSVKKCEVIGNIYENKELIK